MTTAEGAYATRMNGSVHTSGIRKRLRRHINERDSGGMASARVLIEEPNLDVRDLIVELVAALGCTPLVRAPRGEVDLDDVDVIVAEPASVGAERVFAAHGRRRSRIPVVCTSIYPRNHTPLPPHVAYLVKPFAVGDLQAAIRAALA